MRSRFSLAIGAVLALLIATLMTGGASASATEQPSCTPHDLPSFSTTITGREDSGLHGIWAHDTFTRTTVVTDNCDGTFTLNLKDSGSFTPVIGAASPSGGITLQAESFLDLPVGSIWGGATITVASDTQPVNPGATSDGSVSTSQWASLLFPGNNGELTSWGWTYEHCGETWVNAQSGNSGDITGVNCITVPNYEVRLWTKDCKGSTPAKAAIKVIVQGEKWHELLAVPYETSDGQKGTVTVKPGKTEAVVDLTFAEDAGGGLVKIKIPLVEKRGKVHTDCKPPVTTSSPIPSTSTSTPTAISTVPTTTTTIAPPVQNVAHGKPPSSGESLAYTGASGIAPLLAIGGLLITVGAGALVFTLRRRRGTSTTG
jgi:hypothetical protein